MTSRGKIRKIRTVHESQGVWESRRVDETEERDWKDEMSMGKGSEAPTSEKMNRVPLAVRCKARIVTLPPLLA